MIGIRIGMRDEDGQMQDRRVSWLWAWLSPDYLNSLSLATQPLLSPPSPALSPPSPIFNSVYSPGRRDVTSRLMNHATWRNAHALCFAKNGYVWGFQLAVSCFGLYSLGSGRVLWPEGVTRCQQEGVVRAGSELRRLYRHYGQFPRLCVFV